MLCAALVACAPKPDAGSPASAPSTNQSRDPAAIERHNQAIPYRNSAIDAQNKGDWFAARKALQECVEALGDPDCASELQDLESKHRF